MSNSDIEQWLKIQRRRNLRGAQFGLQGYVDIEKLTGQELVDFIRWNVQAAQVELNEAMSETTWKPWSHYAEPGIVDRDKFVEELIDVANFLGNLLLAAHVTSKEFMKVSRRKDKVIEGRQVRTALVQGRISKKHARDVYGIEDAK